MKITISTYNNNVGIVSDVFLLQNLLRKNTSHDVGVAFFSTNDFSQLETLSGDVAVWVQNPRFEHLNRCKKNIWFINEEWCSEYDFSRIHDFDYVVCKSKYAKTLLEKYRTDVTYLPFLSYDCYDPTIIRTEKFLHLNGHSVQKNTELVMQQTVPLTVLDVTSRFEKIPNNINYITDFLNRNQVNSLLNTHAVHLCPSMYESWGHYLFEGLSTGAEIICSDIPAFSEHLDPDLVHILPAVERKNLDYRFDSDNAANLFPLRKSYYIDPQLFAEYINNFKPKGNNRDRRQLYLDIMSRSEKLLTEFFLNL